MHTTTPYDFLPRDDLSEALYITRKLDSEYAFEGTQGLGGTQGLDRIHQTAAAEEASDIEPGFGPKLPATIHTNAESAPRPAGNWALRKVLAGAHQGWVRSLCVDPVTNEWFVSGLSDALIKVWGLASSQIKATLPGHIMAVRSLAISLRSPYLFSGSEDKTLRCWDLERTNAPAGCQIRDYHGHVGGVYALALHPELDLLFSGGRDSAIRVWDIRSKAQVMVLTGHTNDVTSLVSQTGDPQVCSSSMDGTVRLWDVRMQRCHVTLTHHSKSVRLMQLHPTEATMVSADSTGSIKQWLLPEGALLNAFGPADLPLDPAYDANIINTLSINPATNELFAGFDDGRMHFYDYQTARLLQQTTTVAGEGTPSAKIYASAFDNLGMRLITAENDKSIKIWGTD